jgi:hypothetical protein
VLKTTVSIEFQVDFLSGGPGFESRAAHQFSFKQGSNENCHGVALLGEAGPWQANLFPMRFERSLLLEAWSVTQIDESG